MKSKWMDLCLAVVLSGVFMIFLDWPDEIAVVFVFIYYVFLQNAPWKLEEKK